MPILYPLSGPSITEGEGDGSTVGDGKGAAVSEGVGDGASAAGEGVTSEERPKGDAESKANTIAAKASSARTINTVFDLGLIIMRTC